MSSVPEILFILVLVLGLGIAPVIYSARKLPWVPAPVAQMGIIAALFLSWVGVAAVMILFIKDVAIFRIVLRNRKALSAKSSANA